MPQLVDINHLGFDLPVVADPNMSPLHLLHASFPLIRRLFFREDEAGFHILPLLPPEFHCGTLSPLYSSKGHTLMLEWTKHSIRRVHLLAAQDDTIPLHFSKNIKQFRLRYSKKERGGRILLNGAILQMRQNNTYLLDNFTQ